MSRKKQNGFTLLELAAVVVIIGILAVLGYPSYVKYMNKSKRVDMMTDIQDIASSIEAQKLAKGKYSEVDVSAYTGSYPKQGDSLYNVTVTNASGSAFDGAEWLITAKPTLAGPMKDDGDLSLRFDGYKCRETAAGEKYCGKSREWNE